MMDGVWATGRRHVKISKLYLKALLRRGPNIFVALAWSQVSPGFSFLPLEITTLTNTHTVCLYYDVIVTSAELNEGGRGHWHTVSEVQPYRSTSGGSWKRVPHY